MRKKFLVGVFAVGGLSCYAYVRGGMRGLIVIWVFTAVVGLLCWSAKFNVNLSYENGKAELSSEIHEFFCESKEVEVSLSVTGEELKKIKEVLKKEQIIRFYARLVDEQIRVTMKIGEKEYPDFFVYQDYREFVRKFAVLK